MAKQLRVEIVGDAKSLSRALRQADSATGRFGRSLGKFAKVGGLALGAAGVGGALAVMKVGFEEASESARVMAQTGAVLKSTGGAAKVTAKDVEALASSLSQMSGVDDEAIQSGENMLLTFTKIRNEVGKGNDIFNQATKATLDLSVAMGKDMQSSALLVGKALNDPIKGMSALSRAGIQFTEDQKETIKALVKTGDTMEAQKMILKELETQFGGSAKAAGQTMPGQLAKAQLAFEEVSGEIMTAVLPALVKMLQGFNNLLVWSRENWPRFRQIVVDAWRDVRKAGEEALAYYRENIQPAVENVLNALRAAWDRFGDTILSVTRDAFTIVVTVVKATLINLREFVEFWLALFRGDWSEAWNSLKTIVSNTLKSIFTVMRESLEILRTLGKALGAAILDGMQAGWGAAVREIKEAFRDLVGWIRDNVVDAIVDMFKSIPGRIGDALKGVAGGIGGKLNPFGGTGPFAAGDVIPPGPIGPTGGGSFPSLTPGLHDEASSALASFAYQIQSYNPASRLPSGGPSDHAVFPAKAFDAMFSPATGWSNAGARAFFVSLIGRPGIHYAILGDRIWSAERGLHSYGYGGHDNHVHVSSYDQGGFLQPGWNLAWNGTGRLEPVGSAGATIHVHGSVITERDLLSLIRRELGSQFTARNARGAF